MQLCYRAFNRKKLSLRKQEELAKKIESLKLARNPIYSEYEKIHVNIKYCLDEGLKAIELRHHQDVHSYAIQGETYKAQLATIVEKHRDLFDEMDSLSAAYEAAKEEFMNFRLDHLYALREFSAHWVDQK